jgi:hypothetical protein
MDRLSPLSKQLSYGKIWALRPGCPLTLDEVFLIPTRDIYSSCRRMISLYGLTIKTPLSSGEF